jgi:mannose-6-phosphate isomerase-like protein (cupin superfamily)
MLVKDIKKSDYTRVIDGTTLCELLHPKNDGLELDFSIAHAVLKAGNSSLPHKISGSVEIYFLLEGGEKGI